MGFGSPQTGFPLSKLLTQLRHSRQPCTFALQYREVSTLEVG